MGGRQTVGARRPLGYASPLPTGARGGAATLPDPKALLGARSGTHAPSGFFALVPELDVVPSSLHGAEEQGRAPRAELTPRSTMPSAPFPRHGSPRVRIAENACASATRARKTAMEARGARAFRARALGPNRALRMRGTAGRAPSDPGGVHVIDGNRRTPARKEERPASAAGGLRNAADASAPDSFRRPRLEATPRGAGGAQDRPRRPARRSPPPPRKQGGNSNDDEGRGSGSGSGRGAGGEGREGGGRRV